jgi:hypothetical protein
MMSETVNLKRPRKRLARADKELKAHENRERFGRSRAEQEKTEKEKSREDHHLDGHKRES